MLGSVPISSVCVRLCLCMAIHVRSSVYYIQNANTLAGEMFTEGYRKLKKANAQCTDGKCKCHI